MIWRERLIGVFVGAWLSGIDTAASECIGIGGDVTYWWNHATKVFIADVRTSEDSGQRVVFNVLEGFKGVHPGRLAVQVYPEIHGFFFQVGQRVLVYGYPPPGDPEMLSTSCSPTRLITLSDEELLTLRRLAQK
jgi:hypothetical protein